ncbi:hypothetical protein SAMN02745121_06021 [Nannocystis exedens]|uniref:Uncharacterized protein n=1 Tax=Nannocystis exedens TaxID=54 RepID=A0A1I2ECS3_9BACT|nr:hypothetical protein [Nannocystis exedens]PCC74798.1 hypothetical protein NAEX_07898 [Nannocystis exedens]SFE90665.1 hypothetical protein SAMN02745121_06021 [Nannocystis exedens]
MSQHEIEDTVADSVRLLHEHHRGDDHRDLFAALYAFQAEFDCGFTHGRVLEILLERRFTYRLPIDVHPLFAANRRAFKGAPPEEWRFVDTEVLCREPPDDRPLVGHENGYLLEGALYCDVGTPLWHELVAAGTLKGADAEPPRPPRIGAVALHVARAAEKVGDRELIAMWLSFGPRTLFPRTRRVRKGEVLATNPFTGEPIVAEEDRDLPVEPTAAELAADPDAVALRDLARRLDAKSELVHYDWRPPRELWSEAEAWLWD